MIVAQMHGDKTKKIDSLGPRTKASMKETNDDNRGKRWRIF